jgi:hypothetical protein
MKLKFELVNGCGILIDEKAEIKEGEWAIEMYNGQSQAVNPLKFTDENGNNWFVRKMNMYCGKNDHEAHKIIFAEKELKLEGIPVFEWREFEVEKSLDRFVQEYKIHPMESLSRIEGVTKRLIKDFYKSNPAKYTEEDLRKASDWFFETKGRKSFEELIQSLQKYPKYVVMESEYDCCKRYVNCKGCDATPEMINYRPKLFINSEDKQQGVIKELIW